MGDIGVSFKNVKSSNQNNEFSETETFSPIENQEKTVFFFFFVKIERKKKPFLLFDEKQF